MYKLKWFGHLQRLPKEEPARKAYDEAPKRPVKKLRRGQPLTLHRISLRSTNQSRGRYDITCICLALYTDKKLKCQDFDIPKN